MSNARPTSLAPAAGAAESGHEDQGHGAPHAIWGIPKMDHTPNPIESLQKGPPKKGTPAFGKAPRVPRVHCFLEYLCNKGVHTFWGVVLGQREFRSTGFLFSRVGLQVPDDASRSKPRWTVRSTVRSTPTIESDSEMEEGVTQTPTTGVGRITNSLPLWSLYIYTDIYIYMYIFLLFICLFIYLFVYLFVYIYIYPNPILIVKAPILLAQVTVGLQIIKPS